MPRRENTFRVDYSQFPKLLSHQEILTFIGKELGLTRENVLLIQPSKRLGCTFVEVNNLELAEEIVKQHDNKHEFVFDGKTYKLRIIMEDGAVEVRLFDLSNEITNDQIAEFLTMYGDVINIRDLLWDERSSFGGVKTGVRIARMVVKKNIPSLVTIRGEDTAVGYKGQRQTCLHCQEFVHVGIPCVQNKKLLVQKLAADQSYANVAKQPALLQKPAKPNNPSLNVPKSQVQPSSSGQLIAKPNETRPPQQASTMPPPPAPKPLGVKSVDPTSSSAVCQLHQSAVSQPPSLTATQKIDGNETDCSQTSTSSNNSRKKAKKLRLADPSEHDRASGDSVQQ